MNKYQIMIVNESNPYNAKTRSIFVNARDAHQAEKLAQARLNDDEEIIDIEWISGKQDKSKRKHGRILGKRIK